MSLGSLENTFGEIDEKYYNLIVESSLQGILTLDTQFNVTYGNSKICELLGYTAQELAGKSFLSLIPPEEASDQQLKYQRRMSGEAESYVCTLLGKNHPPHFCQVTAIPVFDKEGAFQGSFALIKDISAKKTQSQEAKRSQKDFRALDENLPDIVFRFDHQLKLMYINDVAGEILGLPVKDYIGKTLRELALPETIVELWKKTIQKVFASKSESTFDYDLDTPQGLRHFETAIIPEFSIDGSVGTFFSITRDLTEKILKEQKNREAERKWQALFEQVEESFFLHDASGKILDANRFACESLGYSRRELLKINFFDIEQDYTIEEAADAWNEVQPGGVVTLFGHHKRKDGSQFPVEARLGIFENNGELVFLALDRDISERKKAEEVLFRANERVQIAARAAHLGIWEWDIQSDQLIWDERMRELYGVSPKKFVPVYKGWRDLLYSEDVEKSDQIMQQAIQKEIPYDTEFRVKWPDQSIHYLQAYGKIVKDASGENPRMIGVNFDITERKWIEDANRIMAEAQWQIVHARNEGEIYQTVGQKVQEVLGDGYVGVTALNESAQTIKLVGSFGMGSRFQELIDIYKIDPLKIVFNEKDMDEYTLGQYEKGRLEKFEGGIYGLALKKVPRSICRAIEKTLRIAAVYTMGFVWENRHYGGVIVCSRREIEPVKSIIESIVNVAAQSLKKIKSELVLRESEERFRGIFEEAPIGIILSMPDTRIIDVNLALSRLLGYSLDEFKTFFSKEITYPDDVEESVALNEKVSKGELPYFTLQKRYLHKDGRIIWADVTVTGVHSQSGKVINLLAMIQDITEKKHAEEALEYEQYLMHTLMENIPDPVYFKDLGHQFIRVNQAAAKKFSLQSPVEVLGKTDADFFPPDIAREGKKEEDRIIATGEPVIGAEAVEVWKDQRPDTWASSTKMALRDKSGKIIGTFGLAHDITDRKAKEEEIKQLNADLEKRVELRTKELSLRNQELEAFTYSISHDLKAPLRGITGYAQLLLQEHAQQLDEEGKSFLNKLILSSEQLARLIDDLLNYSRLERRPINWVNLSIKEIVDIAIEERMPDIKQCHVTLHRNIEDERIYSSAELLTQILRNFLDNALKFSDKMEHPEIWISYERKGNGGLFSIHDNGIGFDMKYNEKIFEVFYRLHRIDEYSGTGIGLALVKKAAEILGCRVWAEGKPGEGATFYLEIKSHVV